MSEGDGWDGYIVAIDENEVVGAIGGGMIEKDKSEVFVLYLDPDRRGEGIGSKLLKFLTDIPPREGIERTMGIGAKRKYERNPFL
ncbi:GNAT family N-acetyltransferase [Halobacillus andaensis]|uniref:GNAT family N-acetyltransferase n=1 Tax=Halobacillus andaensis TaxID=1176239 RepID=UPI003D723D75